MDTMSKKIFVEQSVKAYLDSARSALIDADSLPGALQHNASRYFLLLIAWELTQITHEKLSERAGKTNVNPKLLKDHGYKLRESPPITYINIVKDKLIETRYASEDQKKDLRKLLIYGRDDISRQELFMRGWNFNTLRNRLISKIKLLEITVEGIEGLEEE